MNAFLMHKVLLALPFVLSMAVAIAATPAAAAQESERPIITLAADAWCPYNCNPQSDKPGYVIELAREIFARVGYRVDYINMPWARALKFVDQGAVTGAIGATRQELPSAFFPSEEVGLFHGHFILPIGLDWHYDGPESLVGMRLGVINSYDYGAFNAFVEDNPDSSQIQVLNGDDAITRGLGMLVRGRLDAFLEDRDVAMYTARQMGVEQQVIPGDPVGAPIRLYLAFSGGLPESETYARILSDGIGEMRASGRLEEILRSYGLSDWK